MSTLKDDFDALERMARFPAGVSADPTENMSPEDAAKWEAMNDQYGDKFKTAMEHSTDEARKQYLKDHPNADPKNHTVKKPGGGGSSGGGGKGLSKVDKHIADVAAGMPTKALGSDEGYDHPKVKALTNKLKKLPLPTIKRMMNEAERAMLDMQDQAVKSKDPADQAAAAQIQSVWRAAKGAMEEASAEKAQRDKDSPTKHKYMSRAELKKRRKIDHGTVKELKDFEGHSKSDPIHKLLKDVGSMYDAYAKPEMVEKVLDHLETMKKHPSHKGDAKQIGDLQDKLKKQIGKAAHTAAFDELATLDLEVTELSIPEVGIERDLVALEEMERLAAIDRAADSQIGAIILEQMGGPRRLSAMLGLHYLQYLPNGVEFGWPNKQRSKGNHVKITLDPSDTYTVEFLNSTWVSIGRSKLPKESKRVKKLNGVYADSLIELFERQTGWYLRMAGDQARRLAQLAGKTALAPIPTPGTVADEDDILARFEEGEDADPTKNMSEEDAKKWRIQHLKNKDKFKEGAATKCKHCGETLNSDDRRWLGPNTEVCRECKMEGKKAGKKPTPAEKAEAKKLFDKWRKDVSSPGEMDDLDESWQNFLDGDLSLADIKKHPPTKKATFESGSRIPDGWDPGHVEGDPDAVESDEGSDVPDGNGNQKKRAAPVVHIGPRGVYRNRWPFVYAHGLAEDLLGHDVVTFDKPAMQGVVQAVLHDDAGGTHDARIYSWTSQGMPAGLVVLTSDRKGMAEAEREYKSQGKVASDKEARSGLYGHTKRVQADCESCIRKVQRSAQGIARAAYSKNQKVAEFLSVHADRAESLPAQILVSALSEIGPKVAAEMKQASRLAELRAQRQAASLYRPWLAEIRQVLKRFGYPESAAETLWREGMGPGEVEDRARLRPGSVGSLEYTHNIKKVEKQTASPQGKAQQAIMAYLTSAKSADLTDIARNPELRGVHFAKIMSAAESLAQKGLVTFDGVKVTKLAKLSDGDAQTGEGIDQTSDKDKKAAGKTAGSGASNAKYLNSLPAPQKAKILKTMAKHYGISTAEAEAELTDRDAEALYEYIANDRSLAMQVYNDFKAQRLASEKVARSYGLYGFPEKVAKVGLSACSDLRAEAGRIAYDLHRRRASRHADITAFLDTHCKTAECKYSRLLAASYPAADSKVAAVEPPRTVAAWLEWED